MDNIPIATAVIVGDGSSPHSPTVSNTTVIDLPSPPTSLPSHNISNASTSIADSLPLPPSYGQSPVNPNPGVEHGSDNTFDDLEARLAALRNL